MNLTKQIRGLDNEAATKCLALVRKSLEDDPEYGTVIASPDQAKEVLDKLGAKANDLSAVADTDPELARKILLMMVDDDELRPRVEAALEKQRYTLFEPVTTALILSGIVILLSTHIKVKYENRDGKKHVSVAVEKKPTDKTIIKKIISVLH